MHTNVGFVTQNEKQLHAAIHLLLKAYTLKDATMWQGHYTGYCKHNIYI